MYNDTAIQHDTMYRMYHLSPPLSGARASRVAAAARRATGWCATVRECEKTRGRVGRDVRGTVPGVSVASSAASLASRVVSGLRI